MLTPEEERWHCESEQDAQKQPRAGNHAGSGQAKQSERDEPNEGERLVSIGHSRTLRHRVYLDAADRDVQNETARRSVFTTRKWTRTRRFSSINRAAHRSRLISSREIPVPRARRECPCTVRARLRRAV